SPHLPSFLHDALPIFRNRQKLMSTIGNAQRVLDLQREEGSFDSFVWSFVGSAPLAPERKTSADIPTQTPESVALSSALRQRGFRSEEHTSELQSRGHI